jgi:hypothetical protein
MKVSGTHVKLNVISGKSMADTVKEPFWYVAELTKFNHETNIHVNKTRQGTMFATSPKGALDAIHAEMKQKGYHVSKVNVYEVNEDGELVASTLNEDEKQRALNHEDTEEEKYAKSYISWKRAVGFSIYPKLKLGGK